jgi:pimeloyl-ACP methyl ester carboxylesterase
VVLVHPGIANASFMLPQLRRLAEHCTCFAFDSAGFGSSDPVASGSAAIADLADALAAAMQALRLPAVPVFGYHSGAVVALELAHRHPQLVSGLILDGLPLFNADEVEELFGRDFAPPLQVDELGGHYAQTWTRFRDQTTFYPWCARTPDHLIPLDVAPAPEVVHAWMCYFFRSAKNYAGPFRGAHTYGALAARRLATLRMPAAFLMAENDLLAAHATRFPPLRPGQRLLRIDATPETKHAQLLALLREFESGAAAPDDPVSDVAAPAVAGIARDYVDLEQGQLLVRQAGAIGAPAIVLLHDAPGSAQALTPLITALAQRHRVYAFDLPGCGESDALPESARSLGDYSTALRSALLQLGLNQAAVFGTGFGASLAIEFALRAPDMVSQLLLHGVLLPTIAQRTDLRANYAPTITIEATGAHWYRTWLMLRDSLIYFPWYRRTRATQRPTVADFGAERLHDWTFDVMKQIHAYPHLINASLEQHAEQLLPQLRLPVLWLDDSSHRFNSYSEPARVAAPVAGTQHLHATVNGQDSQALATQITAWYR